MNFLDRFDGAHSIAKSDLGKTIQVSAATLMAIVWLNTAFGEHFFPKKVEPKDNQAAMGQGGGY